MFTKRIVNYLIIVGIVSGLLFSYSYINSLVSHKYEIEDVKGNLTHYQQAIVEQVDFNKVAIQILFSALIVMIGLRISMQRWTKKTEQKVK
jgi:hypothetical protein